MSVGSLIGRDFDLSTAATACGLDPSRLVEAADDALLSGLVVEARPGRLSFSHALVQHAVDERLSFPRKAAIHRRIAEALEVTWERDPSVVADLARHWGEVATVDAVFSATAATWAVRGRRHGAGVSSRRRSDRPLRTGIFALGDHDYWARGCTDPPRTRTPVPGTCGRGRCQVAPGEPSRCCARACPTAGPRSHRPRSSLLLLGDRRGEDPGARRLSRCATRVGRSPSPDPDGHARDPSHRRFQHGRSAPSRRAR